MWEGGWFDPPETQLHVIVSAALIMAMYLILSRLIRRDSAKRTQFCISASAVMGLGLVREFWNHWEGISMGLTHKFFSMWDIVWNAVGVATGIVAILIVGRVRSLLRGNTAAGDS